MKLLLEILNTFNFKYKILFASIFIVGLIKYFLELLTLSSLLPLIAILSDGKNFANSKFGAPINDFMNFIGYNLDYKDLINVIIVSFLTLFIIRTIFGIFCIYFENLVRTKLVLNAQSRFIDYFNNSDNENEDINTFPGFLRTISEDVDRMVNFAIFHFQAILEIIFVFSILFILSKISLNITLVSFAALFLLIIAALMLTKKPLKNLATNRQFYEKKATEIIQNIFVSSILIRLLGRQKYFKNVLNYFFKNKLFLNNKKVFIIKSPKFIIELLIIICFLLLLFYFNNYLSLPEREVFIPTLGFFLVCILRLSPLVYNLSNFFQERIYLKNSAKLILHFYNEEDSLKSTKKSLDPSISDFDTFKFENISFSYDKLSIFKNLNFQIKSGQKIGLKSKSGSGKSTLIFLILGVTKPDEGKIIINDIRYNHTSQISRNFFGYVPQVSFYFNSTIIENIAFGEKKSKINYEKIEKIFNMIGINEENFGKNFQNKLLGENGSNFSGGQLQRISIARSLYYEPRILILDEATSQIDKDSEEKLLSEIIKNYKKLTLVTASHNFSSIIKILDLYEIKDFKLNKIN